MSLYLILTFPPTYFQTHMSDTTMTAATTDQWMQMQMQMQFYQQQPHMNGSVHALPPPNSTPTIPSENTILSPTNSLSPKGSLSKPIRRRSRSSKKTPTTLLNANTTNFRALVQQFTGCPSTTTMPSPSLYKGPITLNFQQGSRHQIQHNTETRIMQPSSTRNNNQIYHQLQEQQSGYSRPSTTTRMDDVSGGLLVDHDFSLHDLTVNSFSNDDF
ncbi:uncharacterized protein LOC130723384 [Lotus japonicus]|uniref:uncharacterized protein LOC130723384 n=1 Tax=Lotus japonicus TaxID=34305 RepID=UPI00258CB2E7|nr:uncharacterized protein LOC130723384 [Lotus japonicus]